MKVYLASKFALKDRVIEISDYLKSHGIKITYEWWFDNIKGIPVTDKEWYNHPSVIEVSNKDFNGVDEADIVVLVSDDTTPLSFNGANVEIGYALAKGKQVYILGKVDRNALYSRVVFCSSIANLIGMIQTDA